MENTLSTIQRLVDESKIKISEHGYDELHADDLTIDDILCGLPTAEVLEDYPDLPKGPCVLVLRCDQMARPIHVVWGIPVGHSKPAVLVTAYRPDSTRWSDDFKQRI